MPRIHKRKAGARRYADYSDEALQECLTAVTNGDMSQRAAAAHFKIPRRTINHKLKNLHEKKPGKPTIFSHEEEEVIGSCVIEMSNFGFPVDSFDLKHIVKDYLEVRGRNVPQFKNNMPGDDWVRNFVRRNAALTVRLASNIKKSRAAVDENIVREYIENLGDVVNGIPPENIWNYDESNLTDNPGQKKVITKRGCKYPERICNASKSSISLMYAGSAAGELLPPYVVYKSAHMWNTWTENGPRGTRYNNSPSGWFDSLTFTDWFQTLMLPRLKKLEGKKVLIGDNLSSHITQEVLDKCRQNDIYFVCLPPNSTHLTQPLDVAFFHPLKQKWRQILSKYKSSHKGLKYCVLQKQDFPALLKCLHDSIAESAGRNLISGFLKCGIYPCDVSPLLERLPFRSCERNDVEASFKNFLAEKRLQVTTSEGPTRGRKRVRVDAGKSIAHETEKTCSMPSYDSHAYAQASKTTLPRKRVKKCMSQISAAGSEECPSFTPPSCSDTDCGDRESTSKNIQRRHWTTPRKICGEFVVFSYEGEIFPGQILKVETNGAQIKAMQRSKKSWKWPAKEDILFYSWNDVLGSIGTPKQISKRGFFSVPELIDVWQE